MAESLVGEVAAWLRTPAAQGMPASDRLVLMIIAERAHKVSRKMLWHRGDRRDDGTKITLTETLQLGTGLGARGLGDALKRLADRGIEVRMQIDTDSLGRPVFARRGHAVDYHVPLLPASVELPPAPDRSRSDRNQSRSGKPVDNS
ncbi:hypothetical protein AB0K21_21860 [Streptosporangium sp. NPDC049248]|uniref:hypothetical protein n=1 Tax=Streptosporangium sp. NPDC049248 TaxID=3155651 RepID=UPI0034373A95